MNTDDAKQGPSPIPRGKTAGQEPTELYKLCYEKLPKHRKTTETARGIVWRGLDISKISEEIGVSKQKISNWMKMNQLPPKRILVICNLSGAKIKPEDLWPFVKMG